MIGAHVVVRTAGLQGQGHALTLRLRTGVVSVGGLTTDVVTCDRPYCPGQTLILQAKECIAG